MATGKNSAEIVNMEDARARRRGDGFDASSFRDSGAHLASVREAMGISIEDAATKTHIKVAHLTAIEELDIPNLPMRAYAIGFVKSYAEFLDLDAPAVVERFKHDAAYEAAAPIEPEKFEAASDAAEEVDTPELSLWAVGAILVFMIWCSWQILKPQDAIVGDGAAGAQPLQIADPVLAPPAETVIEAAILERVEPVYPLNFANDADAAETVVVRLNISIGGNVAAERILSSTTPCFDAAAINAVRRWRFEPSSADGKAQPVYDQQVQFSFPRP